MLNNASKILIPYSLQLADRHPISWTVQPCTIRPVRNVRGETSLVVTLCTTWFNSRKFYVLPIEWKNTFCIVLKKKIFPEKQFTYCFSNGDGVYLYFCAVGLRTESWNIMQINLELKGLDWRRTCVCVLCKRVCYVCKKVIIVYLYIYETGKYVQHTRSATQDKEQSDPSLGRVNEDSTTVIFRLISGH